MYLLYNILIILFGIISAPYIIFKVIVDPRFKKGIFERFGFIDVPPKTKKRIWVHAASVGEVNLAYSFINELKKKYPESEIIMTVVTPEGYDIAKEKLGALVKVFFFCLDYTFSVKSFLNKIAPDMVIIMETEIWPNLLKALNKRGIPVGMVNGRISERSFGRYRLIKSFTKKILKNVDFFLMQEEEYKKRLETLTISGANIIVTGNIKFDIDESSFKVDGALADKIAGVDYIIAASTHDGEEKKLLNIFEDIRRVIPEIKLAIAPRHLKRSTAVEALLSESGIRYIKRTEFGGGKKVADNDVILIDTMGELATFFKHAKIVFMGGSLVNVGGHNILEPAYFSKPILFGPHMQNFADARDIMLIHGGALAVRDERELKDEIISLLQNKARGEALGRNAKLALEKNAGALKRTLDEIGKYI